MRKRASLQFGWKTGVGVGVIVIVMGEVTWTVVVTTRGLDVVMI
jgi:hypothetical protein